MRDEDLRALERQAQSGAEADLAAWLQARVRVGDPYRCGDLSTRLPAVYRAAEALRSDGAHRLVLTPRRNRPEGLLEGARTLVLESRPEPEIERSLWGVAGEAPGALIGPGTLILEGPLFHQTWQVRLAAALDSGQFRPVGAREATSCASLRLIVATRSTAGLRPELAVLLGEPLVLPALAERPEDVELELEPLLPERVQLSPEAWEVLRAHPWPGNRVELSACATRLIQLATREPVSDVLARHALESARPLWSESGS